MVYLTYYFLIGSIIGLLSILIINGKIDIEREEAHALQDLQYMFSINPAKTGSALMLTFIILWLPIVVSAIANRSTNK